MKRQTNGRIANGRLDDRSSNYDDDESVWDVGETQQKEQLLPFIKKSTGRVSLLKIFRYASGLDWLLTSFGGICAFAVGVSSPLFMFFFGRMTTAAYGDADTTNVTTNFAIIMTCIGSLTLVLSFVQNVTFLVCAARQAGRLKCAYFSAVLGQDITWHDDHKPGELISRLTGDTRVFQNGINDKLGGGIEQLGSGILGFVFAFISCWELTLLVLGAFPIVGIVTIIISRVTAHFITQTREQYAVAGSIATETMENIKTVQSFNRELYEADRFADRVLNSRSTGIRKEFMVGSATGSAMGIMFCVFACAFIFASYLVEWGRADAGTISTAFLSVMNGASGFGQLFPTIMALTEACTAAYPLFKTIDRPPAIDVNARGFDSTFNKSIEFRNMTFAYPGRQDQPVFRNFNFAIHKGEKIALSGATGCGKSTILALIQRFYDPTAGAVLVDGTDLRRFSLKRWRNLIAVVSQEPSLFSGSVLDNVRVGRPSASNAEVVMACKQARIHDTILTFPEGYDTAIGAVGSQLSGGQKQRLAIARAIVRRASILLLDEATSALDRKSEVLVQAALDELILRDQMTVITIAHRLATIKQMDCIYYLETDRGGTYVAECGTFETLMQNRGRFAALAMLQGVAFEKLRSMSVHGEMLSHAEDKSYETASYASNSEANDPISMASSEPSVQSQNDSVAFADADNLSEISDEHAVPFHARTRWEKKNTEVSIWRVIKLTKSHAWAIVLGFLGSIIVSIVAPVCALILSQVIDILGTYENDKDAKNMHKRTWVYIPLFFVVGVGSFAGNVLTGFYGYAGEHLTYYLRTTLYHQILRQDQVFFDLPSRDAGSLAGILSGDCEAVHQLYGPTLGSRLKTFFSLCGGLVIGLFFQWKVSLVAASTMPLLIAGLVLQQIFFADATHVEDRELDVIVSEALTAIRTVHSFNMKDSMIRKFKRAINEEQLVAERRCVLISLIVALTEFTSTASIALAFWYGGTLIEKGETKFGSILIATMAITMATSFAGTEAGSFATKLRDARRAARNVFSIIDRVPDVDTYKFGDTDFGEGCDIVLDRLRFTYPARSAVEVLRGVNLHFRDGTSNGLIGQTGCGKSTIVQVLARFYSPKRGTVWMNGKDLCTLDTVTWRNNISVVLQEPALFSGTIRENIRYSVPDATDAEVFEAAKVACLHEDVMKMEKGYDTEVGYHGRELSGGQKQRVAIARGVLRCPRLLLLDEATSALDTATETAVQLNLDAYQRRFGITIVCIAHRLSTIQRSDQIILLEDGKILERGTHEQLLKQNGEYKARWELNQ